MSFSGGQGLATQRNSWYLRRIEVVEQGFTFVRFHFGSRWFGDHNYMELTSDIIDEYRNTGGFDMIGSGRTKLETKEQFDKGLEILKSLTSKAGNHWWRRF